MEDTLQERHDPAPSSKEPSVASSLEAKELGLSPLLGGILAAGVVALALAGLLYNIWLSGDGSSEGLADTLRWFGWLGGTAVSLALLGAGLTGERATPGVRAAFLLFGAYLLVATQTSGASGLASLFSSFFSGP